MPFVEGCSHLARVGKVEYVEQWVYIRNNIVCFRIGTCKTAGGHHTGRIHPPHAESPGSFLRGKNGGHGKRAGSKLLSTLLADSEISSRERFALITADLKEKCFQKISRIFLIRFARATPFALCVARHLYGSGKLLRFRKWLRCV